MRGSHLAQSERKSLCNALMEVGPDAPTLCGDWLAKDLAAHVFVRERRPLALPGLVIGSFADLTEISMEAALWSHGFAALVSKVRSGPPLPLRPFDVVNLFEFFVHTEDVRRAAPNWEPRNDPQLDIALWASLGRWSKMLTHKLKGIGLVLERPDGEQIVARRAEPRAVLSGAAQELVLFLHDRRDVARVSLSGPDEAQKLLNETTFGP